MKLYYSPAACSLAPHIALYESGLPFEAVLAPTKTKKLPDGQDYRTITSKGYVPALQLDDGTVLTEAIALLEYIGEQVPEKGLIPDQGTLARYRFREWLAFTATELHKGFAPLFNPATAEDAKPAARERLMQRMRWVDEQLAGHDFLLGERYSLADAYLFVVCSWGKYVQVDLTELAHLQALMARVSQRPAVQQALRAEGLLK